MSHCATCGKTLQGRQRRFCSRSCKNRDTNNRHQSYDAQQRRGYERKRRLVRMKGGGCEHCGYCRNLAALAFHHLDPGTKEFALDLRSLSNRGWDVILLEAEKCSLLCHNCHSEAHHPDALL